MDRREGVEAKFIMIIMTRLLISYAKNMYLWREMMALRYLRTCDGAKPKIYDRVKQEYFEKSTGFRLMELGIDLYALLMPGCCSPASPWACTVYACSKSLPKNKRCLKKSTSRWCARK